MAIDFKTALMIQGVTVQPGYPALSGLTTGRVLRASDGTTVAFAALVAADLPSNVAYKDSDNQFTVGQGIRGTASGVAAGLCVPWVSGAVAAIPAGTIGYV